MARGFGPAAPVLQQRCPCGSGEVYQVCCHPLHSGRRLARTAEQLMRSRYAAYALEEVDYLIETHPDPGVPPAERRRDLRQSCRQTCWTGLVIQVVRGGDVEDLDGTVQFEAHYRTAGRGGVLRENSLFRRRGGQRDGAWYYCRAL